MADTTTRLDFTERVIPLSEASTGPVKGRRFEALLIKAGWSLNNRYYSEAMLKEYGPAAFPAGALGEADHPSYADRENRPEGSIKNTVSVLATDARWDPAQGGLVAEVEVFPQHENLLNERFARAIGLSIRAGGTGEHGKVGGREGLIVTSLDEGGTVDWVTHPGAGGRVLQLLESAPVLHEGHGMTANDLRRSLQDAVDDVYDNRCGAWAWVSDYSDDFVIYSLSGREVDDGLYRQAYTVDTAGSAALTGDATKVNVRTDYVPVLTDGDVNESTGPAAPPAPAEEPVTESTPVVDAPPTVTVDRALLAEAVAQAMRTTSTTQPITPLKEAVVTTPEPTGAPPTGASTTPSPIDSLESARRRERELERQLTEARAEAEAKANDRLARVEAERSLEEARTQIARMSALETARSVTTSALNESALPDCVYSRVIASVAGHEGQAVPLTESRTVNTDALKESVATAIKSWEVLVGQILESAGLDGRVKGLGAPKPGTDLTESQFEERAKARFMKQGMTEAMAATAAAGRN